MRHILTSFLALHWAVVFALLAFICIGGDHGVATALSVLGVGVQGAQSANLENAIVAAPLATAFLVVAVLFCWAFVEVFVGDAESHDAADGIIRIAFTAAAAVLSLILVGGAAQGISGLFVIVAAHLAAFMTSYLAIVAERWSAAGVPDATDVRASARAMARGAAHNSMLSRISGRADAGAKESR